MKKISKLTRNVTDAEFNKAHHKWNALMNPPYKASFGEAWNYFGTFLGKKDHNQFLDFDHIKVSEAAANKIEMLNSPHAHALMKAFIARTGYQKKLVK